MTRFSKSSNTEAAWRAVAERFRHRTEERVNALRAAASDLFQIHLPAIAVPEVAEEQERFFYLFLVVGTSTDELFHAARRLAPDRAFRQRALRRAPASA